MARSSRHRSHRADRRSSRDWRGRSDSSDSEEEQGGSSRGRRQRDEAAIRSNRDSEAAGWSNRDSESERRRSTPGRLESDKEGPSGLASGESSGERGKKRKERSGDAPDAATAAAANRWKGDTDVAATVLEEKDMKAKEISDVEKAAAKPRPSSLESKGKSNKRQDGSHDDKGEGGGARDESSTKGSEKESSRRCSGTQQADPKESSRRGSGTQQVDLKESSQRGSDTQQSDPKESSREVTMDRPSGKERNDSVEMEKDNVAEKVKVVEKEERSTRRDKERLSRSQTKQHSGKGKCLDDKREELSDLTSKPSKLGCTEAGDKITKVTERDCSRTKDSGNTDKKVQDKKKGQEDDLDHADTSSTHTTNADKIHRDRESNDRKHMDKSIEDPGRERRPTDFKRNGRSSRDQGSGSFVSKHYKDGDQFKVRSRLPAIELEDRSHVKDSDKFINDRGKKKTSIEKDLKTSNANDHLHFDCNDGRSRSNSRYGSRADSSRLIRRSSPGSAIDILHDETRRNPRRAETSFQTFSKDKQHTSSCSSGDIGSGSVLIDKAYDFQSAESSSRQKEKVQSTDFSAKESPASQNNSTPKSKNHFSAPRSSEKSTSAGDPDKFNRKGAKRTLDVADIGYHGSFLSFGREHTANEERRRGSFSSRQTPDANARTQLSSADATRSSSSLYNRSDPISPGTLHASNRQGLNSPSVRSSVEDDCRFQSNDRRGNIRHKRTGDCHLGRGQGAAWNGGLPSWPPPFANGFMPFQHAPPGIQPVGPPFASPSLFGVRPFMDFTLSRVPFHIHDSPDRFSSHGRPVGWGSPSDGPYPSCPQGWEGNHGILNDTSTYRREEWEQEKHLSNSGEWNMDGNKQIRPSTKFIHARKEPVAFVQGRGDNLRSEHCNSQADTEHYPDKGFTRLVNTDPKQEAESLQEVPNSPDAATNSGDTWDFKYLSKIDISSDLAQPDLYKHFISIRDTKCLSPCSNANNKIQGSVGCFKLAVQSCNHVDKPPLPVIAGALFEKALTLYNTEGGKSEGDRNIPDAPKLEPFQQSQKASSEALAPETEPLEKTIEPMENEFSEIAAAEWANSDGTKSGEIADRLSEPSAAPHQLHDKTESNCATVTCGSSVGQNGGTAFDNDSTGRCESLISVCLSRIPNSPESTH